MKKIININFHGRIVPIEETALEILQAYVDSLRRYFANEEGRDEIINDIESRFAELFSERLKKGATCITDEDVNSIILSMGRPEDFEQDELSQPGSTRGNGNTADTRTGTNSSAGQSGFQQENTHQQSSSEPRRLYRSENDKILAGVCGGLANYLKLDPAVVRIIFVILCFGFGLGFPLYLVLWVVLPSKSLAINVRKRLFRNPDDRVIAGVASGIASYFNIEVWIPRLIFSLPLIAGLITSIFNHAWFDWDRGPVFFTGGFGGTLFITYIVLWIVLPEAFTASEKLEMRGEKVDLESIKNTVKSDLEGFKNRAKDMGEEMKERFQQAGQEMKDASRKFASNAGPVVTRTRSGLGHFIGLLFKAFFLFIGGIIAFALITVLVWLLFNGVGVFPFKNYLLAGFWQNLLAWTSLCLFLGIPILALVVWLIRRIMGVRSRNNYIGYTMGSLWIIGLISVICLVGMVFGNFRSRASVEEDFELSNPTPSKMLIKMAEGREHYYDSDWFGFNWEHNNAPFYSLTEDTVMMNTVRINLVKSADASFHVQRIKFSRGNSPAVARQIASRISFDIRQQDSLLYLAQGFAITKEERFRNQQVLVIVSVPVGKKIWVSHDIDDYNWFNIDVNRRHHGFNVDWNEEWDNSISFSTNTEYIMTEKGLKRTDRKKDEDRDDEDEDKDQDDRPAPGKDKTPEAKNNPAKQDNGYRYKKNTDTLKPAPKNDSDKINNKDNNNRRDSIRIRTKAAGTAFVTAA